VGDGLGRYPIGVRFGQPAERANYKTKFRVKHFELWLTSTVPWGEDFALLAE